MVSEYTSMLLQMPDCSIPQSPDAAMAEHLSHTAGYLASPAQFAAVSEEPFRPGGGCAQMHAPETHPESRDAGSKACSKCKMTKPLAEFFKDKSKPDGLYSQCKACATSEERRRREERAPLAAEHAKQAKRCTRCRMQKDVEQFCRNSRSFDGRYSQCRTCVANKDKSRRQRLVERRDEPVDAKVCSRCNMDKHNSEYYRDSSKPDGLQTYCKQCLCDKNKTTRKKKRKTGREDLAGGVAFADGAHLPVSEAAAGQPPYQSHEQLREDISISAAMAEPGSRSLSPSQMHIGYSLQGDATEGQDGYGADAGFSADPQQDYSLQTRDQQQPGHTGEQSGGEDLGEKCAGAYLHTPADNSSPGHGCSFNQDQGVSNFINSPDYPAPLAGPFDIAHGYPVQQGHGSRHAQAHHAEQHQSSSATFPQQGGFHEQEVYQTEMQYLPSGYDMAEDAAQQDKHAESNEPLGYLNSEIQEHRSRLAATMLV